MAKYESKFSKMTLAEIKKEIEPEVINNVLLHLCDDNHCPLRILVNAVELNPKPEITLDDDSDEDIIGEDIMTVYGIIRYPGKTKDKQFVTWVEWDEDYGACCMGYNCAIIDAPTLDDLARKYLSKNKK